MWRVIFPIIFSVGVGAFAEDQQKVTRVKDVNAKVVERNDVYVTVAWKVDLESTSENVCDLGIAIYDKDGFELHKDIDYDVQVPSGAFSYTSRTMVSDEIMSAADSFGSKGGCRH